MGIEVARIQYNVVYRPGKANIADCLSRLNQKSPKDLAGKKKHRVHKKLK